MRSPEGQALVDEWHERYCTALRELWDAHKEEYAPDRKAERPIAHLTGFKGVLQVDGSGGDRALAERGDVALAFCWSHVRRRFFELAVAGPAPIASEALQPIADLYAVEEEARGRSADERRALRQTKSRPVLDVFEPWLRTKLDLISQKTKLAEAIRYALSRWAGLTRFLANGRIEIDSNVVERAIRPIALNRKNALFAGSDGGTEHWAVIASLIETCKLCGVRTPISPTSPPESPTAISIARSTIRYRGPIPQRPRSKPWPENTAYHVRVDRSRVCAVRRDGERPRISRQPPRYAC